MARQYVTARFRKEDRKTYTYHNDGDLLVPGDEVKVADRSGDGWQRIYIADVGVAKPDFPTKPILGIAPPRDEETAFQEKLS